MDQKRRKNTRAAKGTGTIGKRTKVDKKTGKTYTWWEARITVGWDKNGKQKRRTITGKTQKEVLDKMKDQQNTVDKGTYVDKNSITLDQWMETWLKNHQVKTNENSRKTYKQTIDRYISPKLGHIKLQMLKEDDVESLVSAMVAQGLSPKTIHCTYGVLHKALSKAVKNKLVSRNVSEDTELPELEEPDLHLLDHTEVAALKNAAVGYKYERFFLLALYLGMREGELLGLNWEQINWRDHKLNVDRQLVWDRANMANKYLAKPKCKSKRMLKMPPTVEKILREQQEEVRFQKEQAGENWIERGLVFPGPHGDFLSRQTVYDCLQRVAKKAGLKPVRVHDLRHTFAAFALEAGVDVRTVQYLLGHATPTFTLRVYAYVNEYMRKVAADKLEAAIGTLEQIAQGEKEETPEEGKIIPFGA